MKTILINFCILLSVVNFNECINATHFNLSHGYVKRDDWNAAQSKRIIMDTHEPVSKIIIAHTQTPMCNTLEYPEPCNITVQLIQSIHLKRANHNDIGYNFLIGGDGQVYEGRGWFAYGVHTKGYNNKSRSIAFIGRYHEAHEEPTLEQVEAAHELIQQGLILGVIMPDYLIYGQRSLVTTESPGDVLFSVIKEWDRFSEDK